MALEEYLWIAVCGGILGFAYGFLIGANDVANAFASSVASKSVTLKQAVLIASVCEFGGAFFLGASVTGTIRSKIVDTDLYEDEPGTLLFGMFTSLFAANAMLWLATHFGFPVSTTHDIVGSIMGFTIAAKGFDSVNWDVAKKIFLSWILSPLLSGAVAAIIFGSVKFFVLRSEKPYERAYWTFPIVVTIGIGIDLFYVLYKASANFQDFNESLELYVVLPASFGTGIGCGLIWLFVVGPFVKKRVEARRDAAASVGTVPDLTLKQDSDTGNVIVDEIDIDEHTAGRDAPPKIPAAILDEDIHSDPKQETAASDNDKDPKDSKERNLFLQYYDKFAQKTFDQDLHAQSMHESHRAAQIWDQGEQFDSDAEDLFTYLQVFTACLNSFAHGANDVSNTIAPLSAIIQIYQDGKVESKSHVQKWVLAYGGVAIVIGLLLYGYRVMKSIGYKLTLMSPSRGFSCELAASLVVVTASFNEIPVSSTQCIVGAISGAGLVGGIKNVEWLFLLKVMFSWVVLYFAATLFSAAIFSFAYYSPSSISY